MNFKPVLIVVILLISLGVYSQEDEKLMQKANDLAQELNLIDCHSHDMFKPLSKRFPKQVDSSMIERSGVNLIVNSYPLKPGKHENPYAHIIEELKVLHAHVDDPNKNMRLVKNSKDFYKPEGEEDLKFLLALEYFHSLCDGKIEDLQKFYGLGFRSFCMSSGGADSIYIKKGENFYTTPFTKKLIKELNRLGMICDITHLPENIRQKAIEISDAPVCVSHANVRSVVESRFNLTDSTLKILVQKGGMICLTFCSDYVSMDYRKRVIEADTREGIAMPDMEDLIDHIDYLKEYFGIDFIGIGSDYGGSGRMAPKGLETIEGFPMIIYHLLKRGYSEEEIAKIMGLNFIRFFERVESFSSN